MLQPAKIDIRADRNVLLRRTFAFVGYNFTGASLAAAVKTAPDAAGPALVSLTTQTTDVQGARVLYAGTDTVANQLAAGNLSQSDVNALLATVNPLTGALYRLVDNLLLSVIAIRIDKTTMENASIFPPPVEGGTDETYAWDLLITPSGGDQDKYAGGAFVIQGGVTA